MIIAHVDKEVYSKWRRNRYSANELQHSYLDAPIRHYYIPEQYRPYYDDLQHFDFKLPNVGKFLNDVGKNASNAMNDIGKNASKAVDEAGKNISKATSDVSKSVSGMLGGLTGREWKNHKWIDRKRNKDGKWIYDYGNGFPGESNLTGDRAFKRTANKDIKIVPPSAAMKFLTPLFGLGKALVSATPQESLQGAAEFIGGFLEVGKQAKANLAKMGTEKDSHGLALKKHDYGKNDDLKVTNPGWDNKDGGSQLNCPCASVAYDMRRRGYEVTAKQHLTGLGRPQVASFYKDATFHQVTADKPVKYRDGMSVAEFNKEKGEALTEAVEDQFKTEPNNTRGMAMVDWQGGGGHIFAYEKEDGVVKFYDAQSGEKLDIKDYVGKSETFEYFRTDNLEPDYEQVKKVIE